MKKTIGLSLLVFVCYGLNLQAIFVSKTRMDDLENQVRVLQSQVNAVATQTALDTPGVNTATGNPEVTGAKWYGTIEALYWHPKVMDTAFAYSNNITSHDVPIKGRTKRIKFDWEWGIRVGVGRLLDHDKWDVYLSFLCYRPHGSKGVSAQGLSTLVPLQGVITDDANVMLAKSQFKFDYYNFDLELGRHYFISSRLSLRPFFGVKNSWIRLKQKTRYSGGQDLGLNTATITNSSDFWGMGSRFGLQSRWYVNKRWFLYSNLAGAFLYGFFDVNHREKHSINPQENMDIDDNDHRFSPMAEFAGGLGYGDYFNNRSVFVTLQLGYEGQYWWRQNQMVKVYETSPVRYESCSEDVTMQGLTIKLRVDF